MDSDEEISRLAALVSEKDAVIETLQRENRELKAMLLEVYDRLENTSASSVDDARRDSASTSRAAAAAPLPLSTPSDDVQEDFLLEWRTWSVQATQLGQKHRVEPIDTYDSEDSTSASPASTASSAAGGRLRRGRLRKRVVERLPRLSNKLGLVVWSEGVPYTFQPGSRLPLDPLNASLYNFESGRVALSDDQVVGKLVLNFRDVAGAAAAEGSRAKLRSNVLYRSACVTRKTLSPEDTRRALVWLRDVKGIRTMIDFRERDERERAGMHEMMVEKVYPTVARDHRSDRRKRYWIPLYSTDMKVRGMFWDSTGARLKAKMITAPIRGAVKQEASLKDAVGKVFAEGAMNKMGLLGLNKLMLEYSMGEIASVLRIVSDPQNHPVMIHCSSGKDRTGMATAMVLLALGVEEKHIIADYAFSSVELEDVRGDIVTENAQKGLSEGFADTPRVVMENSISFLKEKWGGVAPYLEQANFTRKDREAMERAMLLH